MLNPPFLAKSNYPLLACIRNITLFQASKKYLNTTERHQGPGTGIQTSPSSATLAGQKSRSTCFSSSRARRRRTAECNPKSRREGELWGVSMKDLLLESMFVPLGNQCTLQFCHVCQVCQVWHVKLCFVQRMTDRVLCVQFSWGCLGPLPRHMANV